MIKRHWIKRYVEVPPRERSLIIQSWDTASKGGPQNDFSVCTTWFISRDRRWYLIDVWRKRVEYPELKATVRALAFRHAAKRVLVEDAGAGISFVQELLGEVSGILAVKPDRDKTTRMSVVSAKFEFGSGFPSRAWLMARGLRGGALRVPRKPARRSVRFRKPSAQRRQLWAPDADIARGARRLEDSEAMDAALCRPLRVKLAVVDRPTFAQAQLQGQQAPNRCFRA